MRMARPLSSLSLAAAALFAGPVAIAPAAPDPAGALPEIVLKSGHRLLGKVVGERIIEGGKVLTVETDFGQILVPAAEIKPPQAVPPTPEGTTFHGFLIRVVRITGKVERRPSGGTDWFPVSWTDTYGKEIVNEPNAIVRPGDTLRTGADGELDFMPHRDVWVRLTASSEVELPDVRGKASLSLLKGRTIHDVTGHPRGETFRVATPSAVLGVKGTRFGVEVGARERVLVAEGEVEVDGRGRVSEGQTGTWGAVGGLEVVPLSFRERETVTVAPVRLPRDAWVLIPGGEYRLGWLGEKPLSDYALPRDRMPDPFELAQATNLPFRRTVRLPPFLIQQREVTHAEFASYSLSVLAKRWPKWSAAWKRPVVGATRDPFPLDAGTAAFGIQWEAACAFASWLGGRLPKEAEWEAAGRGHTARAFPWSGPATSSHRALVRWSLDRGSSGGGLGWQPLQGDMWLIPPAELPLVTNPTPDVSATGVEALVSGVPEWCLDQVAPFPFAPEDVPRYDSPALWDQGEPFAAVGRKGSPAPRRVVRGVLLSLRIATAANQVFAQYGHAEGASEARFFDMTPGFRCVVELR